MSIIDFFVYIFSGAFINRKVIKYWYIEECWLRTQQKPNSRPENVVRNNTVLLASLICILELIPICIMQTHTTTKLVCVGFLGFFSGLALCFQKIFIRNLKNQETLIHQMVNESLGKLLKELCKITKAPLKMLDNVTMPEIKATINSRLSFWAHQITACEKKMDDLRLSYAERGEYSKERNSHEESFNKLHEIADEFGFVKEKATYFSNQVQKTA